LLMGPPVGGFLWCEIKLLRRAKDASLVPSTHEFGRPAMD
jgi:hypothetical protein